MSDDVLADGAALLDALNQKEFERARVKITKAPLDLTERDLLVLKAYGGAQLEGQAWEAQRLAVLALVPPSPVPLVTKRVKAPAAAPETVDEFLQRHGSRPVNYKALHESLDTLIGILKNHKAKLDTLTQQNKSLSDRVLELEAQRAAVTHVD